MEQILRAKLKGRRFLQADYQGIPKPDTSCCSPNKTPPCPPRTKRCKSARGDTSWVFERLRRASVPLCAT